MPGQRAAREGLDDDHAAAAVWAVMRFGVIGGIVRIVMSSIMRRRNGLMASSVMGMLLS